MPRLEPNARPKVRQRWEKAKDGGLKVRSTQAEQDELRATPAPPSSDPMAQQPAADGPSLAQISLGDATPRKLRSAPEIGMDGHVASAHFNLPQTAHFVKTTQSILKAMAPVNVSGKLENTRWEGQPRAA